MVELAGLALALHRAGFEPVVYERAKELREVGAGIALWANATHILQNLGLLEDAIQVGYLTTNYQFNSQRGKELVNVSVDCFELPVIGIHRAELHQLLWRNVPSEKFVLAKSKIHPTSHREAGVWDEFLGDDELSHNQFNPQD